MSELAAELTATRRAGQRLKRASAACPNVRTTKWRLLSIERKKRVQSIERNKRVLSTERKDVNRVVKNVL